MRADRTTDATRGAENMGSVKMRDEEMTLTVLPSSVIPFEK